MGGFGKCRSLPLTVVSRPNIDAVVTAVAALVEIATDPRSSELARELAVSALADHGIVLELGEAR